MTSKTSYEVTDGIAVLRLDDGKANAVGYDTIAAIDAAVAGAEQSAKALVIVGREGRFSAGFDLSVMGQGPEAARPLVAAGARAAMRIYGARVPVVAACTGHALAFGAIMLLSSDVRIGADIDAKIGLIEVSIGMPLPIFAVELARDRLSPQHFTAATALATAYSPHGAAGAGYLDGVSQPTNCTRPRCSEPARWPRMCAAPRSRRPAAAPGRRRSTTSCRHSTKTWRASACWSEPGPAARPPLWVTLQSLWIRWG